MNKQKYSDPATVAIQKRLNTVFQNCQFVLIWASSKPIDRALTHQLEKRIAAVLQSTDDCTRSLLTKSNAIETLNIKAADFPANDITNLENLPMTTNVSKVSFPKEALNNHCLNISLPIVGCGVDLLVLNKPKLDASSIDNLKQSVGLRSSTTALAKASATPKVQNGGVLQGMISPLAFVLTEQNPGNSLTLDKLLKTHQIAIFIDQLFLKENLLNRIVRRLRQGVLEIRNFESKWHSNQLLGAFIKGASGSILFVSSAELKQSLLLQQVFKGVPPKQIAKKPFIETLTKIKKTYSGQSKYISKLVKNLVYIINRSKYKLISNISA